MTLFTGSKCIRINHLLCVYKNCDSYSIDRKFHIELGIDESNLVIL